MDANGLVAVDSTDVLVGNSDIECGWEVPKPDAVKHLPGHEHMVGADWDNSDLAFLVIAAVGICLGLLA